MATLYEENTKQYIKPTDSDYVKLAKQGGDRDLLVSHDVERSDEAKPYAKCDWFDHIHNDAEDASNRRTNNQMEDQKSQTAKGQGQEEQSARQEGSKIKEKYTRGGIPFYTDNGFSGQVANPRSQPAKEEEQASNSRLEGSKIKEKYTGGGVPYHTDNMSVWERKDFVPETENARVVPRERNPIY